MTWNLLHLARMLKDAGGVPHTGTSGRSGTQAAASTTPTPSTADALPPAQADASICSMFFVTTSIVSPSSLVGLNSTTSVPAYRIGVCPGPT